MQHTGILVLNFTIQFVSYFDMLRNRWKSIFSILVFITCLFSSTAWSKECTLLDVEALGFSSQGTAGITQVASIEVNCTGEYRLSLDEGKHLQGEVRRLASDSGGYIAYRLWQDKGGTKEWGGQGNVQLGTSLIQNGEGDNTILPVYGKIINLGKTNKSSGHYADTVAVTLSWPPYGPDNMQEMMLSFELEQGQECSLSVDALGDFGSRLSGEEDIKGAVLGRIGVTCAADIHYGIGIDSGQHFQNKSRHMSNGTDLLPYTLWSDSTGSLSWWGDAGLSAFDAGYQETCPGGIVKETATGTLQQFTVRGDAAIKGYPPGIYKDTVNITIAW
ncbi:MAG: spore coat U domain-containing protein [Candidatus Electrothrix sp. AUS4]|nr:spore coat U domain-containing protein [Candidatus Electrothrix sp. AUS4]